MNYELYESNNLQVVTLNIDSPFYMIYNIHICTALTCAGLYYSQN